MLADTPTTPKAPINSRFSVVVGLRELMLGWCVWLLASWGVTLLWGTLSPAVRWMTFSALVGLMAVWPALRLSQGPSRSVEDERAASHAKGEAGASSASILIEWLCLLMIFQAVLWPLRLIAHWPVEQTLWLDAAVAAWSLLTAAIVAGGRTVFTSAGRVAAMILCILLLLGEPLVLLLAGVKQPWNLRISPIEAIWRLTGAAHEVYLAPITDKLIWIAAAAGVAWLGLLAMALVGGWRRRARHGSEGYEGIM